LWFKARHKYTKLPDSTDRADFFAQWTAKHDALVADRAERLRDQGYVVKVESDGEFKLRGSAADLAGKPDLVALRSDEVLVVDAKAGKKRASDHWQVLIYMMALPMSWLKGTTAPLRGEVEYPDGAERVRPLGSKEIGEIAGLIKRSSDAEAPAASPSKMECRYCDIAACAFRYQEEQPGDATRYF
jgi:hypothetical protein